MTDLSPNLRAFLYSCIDSIDHLDVLLLLQRSGQGWTARSVADELGLPRSRARAHLDSLAARGLVRVTVGKALTYDFRPASATLSTYCNDLAQLVASSRADVITFVASLPPLSIRAFSNAFRLREQG